MRKYAAPASIRAFVDERLRAAFEIGAHVTDDFFRIAFNRFESARIDDVRPTCGRHIDVEIIREPAHLTVEIREQVRIVHEFDVRQMEKFPP